MAKFRGVHKHPTGGFTATLGRSYVGWYRTEAEAIAARVSAEIVQTGSEYDVREIIISSDHASIPLHGRRGVFYGYAMVDLEDLEVVRQVSWTLGSNGYAVGRPSGGGGAVAMHRLIVHGLGKGGVTDHINGARLDNRRANLRSCTNTENCRNTALAKNNTSGRKGVRKTKSGTWKARITVDRKEIHIGCYATIDEASAAYDAAALMLHGDFARTNEQLDTKRFSEEPCVMAIVTPLDLLSS